MNDVKNFILDTAKERFERFGFKKTVMDEICQDGKISKRTVYEYFKDKEDLFTSLFIRETLRAREVIFSRLGEVPDAMEKLVRLTRIAIDYFNEDSFVTKVLRDDGNMYMPFLSREYHSMVEKGIVGIIAGIVRDGINQGIFRKIDERIAGYMLFKLFQSFSYAKTSTLSTSRKKQAHEIETLTDFVRKALIKEK